MTETIENPEQLEERLSRPDPQVVELFARMQGDVAILGGGGKIGPSLARMACRAREASGKDRTIFVIARFRDPVVRKSVEECGGRTLLCDLLDEQAVSNLPQVPNVLYLAGVKFGTRNNPELTWAANGLIPAYVAGRFRNSRLVAFSTGCVYNVVDVNSGGSVETDPLEPLGEYSNSCVARERIFQYFSNRYGTPMVFLRLNYAVELRYGVLVDIATNVLAGKPVDVTMGYANVIWQGDVNATALRLLEHAASPPLALNVTGAERLSTREIAERFGVLMGKKVKVVGQEASTALLSNPAKACKLLGPPTMPIDQVIEWTAQWLMRGGATLSKPTHFQTRDGKY